MNPFKSAWVKRFSIGVIGVVALAVCEVLLFTAIAFAYLFSVLLP